jgi:hypothetical protein
MKYAKARRKDDEQFDDFVDDFFESMTSIQDPEDADGTLADLTTKFNELLASMREAGSMR